MSSRFNNPLSFRVQEMIQGDDGELYQVLNSEMIPDHFSMKLAALKWDWNNGKWERTITRFILPAGNDYRVFDADTRRTFHLSREPYSTLAWKVNGRTNGVHYQNDPLHNYLP
jgi:hypothetical protein